jgi:hypothetical protein
MQLPFLKQKNIKLDATVMHFYTRLKRLGRDKCSCLLDPFVSDKKNIFKDVSSGVMFTIHFQSPLARVLHYSKLERRGGEKLLLIRPICIL